MKKTILMFAAAGLMLAIPSCKKGEEDPSLSLSSRKARLAGEWNVSFYNSEWTWTDGTGDSSSSASKSDDGTTITTTNISTTGGVSNTSISTATINRGEYTINKDGSFTKIWDVTYVSTQDLGGGVSITNTEVTTNTSDGSWSFIGKDKTGDYKNKERVLFNTTSITSSDQTTAAYNDNGTITTTVGDLDNETETYLVGEYADHFDILQLKGKEIKLRLIGNNVDVSTSTSGGTTVSSSDTYTSLLEITLTVK